MLLALGEMLKPRLFSSQRWTKECNCFGYCAEITSATFFYIKQTCSRRLQTENSIKKDSNISRLPSLSGLLAGFRGFLTTFQLVRLEDQLKPDKTSSLSSIYNALCSLAHFKYHSEQRFISRLTWTSPLLMQADVINFQRKSLTLHECLG